MNDAARNLSPGTYNCWEIMFSYLSLKLDPMSLHCMCCSRSQIFKGQRWLAGNFPTTKHDRRWPISCAGPRLRLQQINEKQLALSRWLHAVTGSTADVDETQPLLGCNFERDSEARVTGLSDCWRVPDSSGGFPCSDFRGLRFCCFQLMSETVFGTSLATDDCDLIPSCPRFLLCQTVMLENSSLEVPHAF